MLRELDTQKGMLTLVEVLPAYLQNKVTFATGGTDSQTSTICCGSLRRLPKKQMIRCSDMLEDIRITVRQNHREIKDPKTRENMVCKILYHTI